MKSEGKTRDKITKNLKGNQNYQHILILFTPEPCSYVN